MKKHPLFRTRTFLTVLVAIAVLSAFIAPLSTANPAPNPYAGKFTGNVPVDLLSGFFAFPWSITIKSSGKIAGEKYFDAQIYLTTGSFAGEVDREGHMSISGIESNVSWGGSFQVSFSNTATATVNAEGNLVVAFDTGQSFIWTRQ